MTFSDFVYQPVKSCTCQTIINHLILIVYGFFLFFSRLQLRAHGGCDMSAVDAHSSKIAYPTSNFLRGATVLYFSFGLFISNTVRYYHMSFLYSLNSYKGMVMIFVKKKSVLNIYKVYIVNQYLSASRRVLSEIQRSLYTHCMMSWKYEDLFPQEKSYLIFLGE